MDVRSTGTLGIHQIDSARLDGLGEAAYRSTLKVMRLGVRDDTGGGGVTAIEKERTSEVGF